jgi:hypothetical protein
MALDTVYPFFGVFAGFPLFNHFERNAFSFVAFYTGFTLIADVDFRFRFHAQFAGKTGGFILGDQEQRAEKENAQNKNQPFFCFCIHPFTPYVRGLSVL